MVRVKVVLSAGGKALTVVGEMVTDQAGKLALAARSKLSVMLPELVKVWVKTTWLPGAAEAACSGAITTLRTVATVTVSVRAS